MQKQALKEAQEWVEQKLAMRGKNLAAIGWLLASFYFNNFQILTF